MLRKRFILFVGLSIVGCVVILNYLFPPRTRLLPGYETLQQTDQGMPLYLNGHTYNTLTCVYSSFSS